MFDLPHVASRIYGTPLLMARTRLEVALAALGPRLMQHDAAEPLAESIVDTAHAPDPPQRASLRITEAGIAILPVMGTLVRRGSWMSAACGLTSYHDLEASAQAAFDNSDVRAVLLEIDSGGGEAGGLFDLVASLRGMAVSTGKPLWAVSDEAALSAAYALACAADKIVVPRTAEVGSVGVVALHVDESARDAKAGLAYTYIHAGARKVDGNPHTPLSPDVKSRLQDDVDTLYAHFVDLVATRRRCSSSHVRATEAAVFRGQKAVAAGLADAVGTLREAHDQLAAYLETHTGVALSTSIAPLTSQEMSMSGTQPAPAAENVNFELVETSVLHPSAQPASQPVSQRAEYITPALSPVADPVAVPSSQANAQASAEAEAAACARLTELGCIAQLAQRLGVTVDPITALREGKSPDTLRQQVLEKAAAQDASTTVVTSHSVEPAKPKASSLMGAVQQLCNLKETPHA